MGTSADWAGLAIPPISAGRVVVTAWTASRASLPVPSASTVPRSSVTTARGAPSERSSPRLIIDVPFHLPPVERERARVGRPEQFAVHARQQFAQPALVGRRKHDHAGALLRREGAIVEIVAVERHERAPELSREPEVLDVARAPQIVVLEDEEHVPIQLLAHE